MKLPNWILRFDPELYRMSWRRAFMNPLKWYRRWNESRDYRYGEFILNCNNGPAVIVYNYGDDIQYMSLLNGGFGSCSIINCRPEFITPERASELTKGYHAAVKAGKTGETYLMKQAGYEEEGIKSFFKDWRPEETVPTF